jgi:hypothetical protein
MSDETPCNHSEDDSLPWVKNEKNDDMDTDDDDDDGLAGSFSNVQVEAIFSRAHRFRRTAPVATTWTKPRTQVLMPRSSARSTPAISLGSRLLCKVVRELALDADLDEFEDAYDLDVPLKLRPFMAKIQAKAVQELRQRLANRVATEFLLSDVPGSARHPEFDDWNQDVTFPVKRQRVGARPSESVRFPGVLIIKRNTIKRSRGPIQRTPPALSLRHKAGGVGWGGTYPKQAAYHDEEERMLGHAWEAAACRCRHQKRAQSGREAGACEMVGGGRTPRTRRTSPCPMTYRQQSPADL